MRDCFAPLMSQTGAYSDEYWFYLTCPACGYHWQAMAWQDDNASVWSLSLKNEDAVCPPCGRSLTAGDEIDLMYPYNSVSELVRRHVIPRPR